ncbi:hypothetical protein ACFXAY_28180 [Streptomyces microflavus]|uniref:hypothetical protein n=1 Tax=Streptomyces microflavus TaxID=1919 RepID=UPI003687323F
MVEAALARKGTAVLRLNTEDFHSYAFNWGSDSPGLHIDRGIDSIDISQAVGCYFRKPLSPPFHPGLVAPESRSFSALEADAFLGSLYALRGVRWISHPALIETAGSKVGQLATARSLGLSVPRTLVTNDPTKAKDFVRALDADILIKPLRTASIELDLEQVDFFARRLSVSEAMHTSDVIRFAPTLIQEFIPKHSEIRVTIIGGDLFAVEITPLSVDIPVDWTSLKSTFFSYKPFELPEGITSRLHEFLGHYGLSFGAFDFVKTEGGQLIFLENNPNGAWYWLEREIGIPMADSMAQLLLGSGNPIQESRAC